MLAISAAPATAVMASTIGMPATAGTTVQTSRAPVAVGSLASPPATTRAPATVGLLQQQGSCN